MNPVYYGNVTGQKISPKQNREPKKILKGVKPWKPPRDVASNQQRFHLYKQSLAFAKSAVEKPCNLNGKPLDRKTIELFSVKKPSCSK